MVADPPYNEDLDYGEHCNNSLSPEEYLARSRAWMTAAARCLTCDGSLWLVISWEWAHDLACSEGESVFTSAKRSSGTKRSA